MQSEQGEDIASKYSALEELMTQKSDHDEIMAHIDRTGITPEESSADFFKVVGQYYNGSPPLFLAVEYERLDVLNSLIQKGFDPHTCYNISEDEHSYLILEACEVGNIDVIKSLIDEHHVDLKVVDREHTAVMNVLNAIVNEDEKLEIVKFLVEKGADVTKTAELAASVERRLDNISEFLISCGGRLLAQPPRYWSPLAHAAHSGNVAIAKMLVEAGAHIKGLEGRKLYFVAAACNHVEVVEYFNSLGIDLDCKLGPYSALKHTVECDAYEVARYLVVDANVSLETKDFPRRTAFCKAFKRKFIETVGLFVKAGYNPSNETCLNEVYHEKDLQELAQEVRDSVAKRTLRDHCVFQVRKSLGKNANSKVEQLPLPTEVKEMVRLDHIPIRRSDIPCEDHPDFTPLIDFIETRVHKILYTFKDSDADSV